MASLNEDQTNALILIKKWFEDWKRNKRKQFFFLSGRAGTGKTYLAKEIADTLCGMDHTVFIAPTGKAAARLRQKGCLAAQTMHHFVYLFGGETDDGDLIFTSKGSLDVQPLLIVLDEASMVGDYDMAEIFGYKIPVLAIGDVGQVPPVRDRQFFTEENRDFELMKIERNGGNIVRAASFVRDGYSLPLREYDDVSIRSGRPTTSIIKNFISEESQIICARNATRNSFNGIIRNLQNRQSDLPEIGEKIVCTFNQHSYSFMNGEQGILLGYDSLPGEEKETGEPDVMKLARIKSLSDGSEKRIKFNPLSFDKDPEVRAEAQKHIGGFDFGYVLTVHKSQGSEWDNVLVIEESIPSIPYRRLMYTAITRASKKLLFYKN